MVTELFNIAGLINRLRERQLHCAVPAYTSSCKCLISLYLMLAHDHRETCIDAANLLCQVGHQLIDCAAELQV